MNRRDLLIGGGLAALGTLVPATARAAAAAAAVAKPDWTLGVTDILEDIAPRSLRRIHGRAPDLIGTLYRNGPARFRRGDSASGHWFDGDGLIRAWQVRSNEARLAARFVDTPKRRLEEKLGRIVQPGFGTLEQPGAIVGNSDETNAANTHVIKAGNRLLALWEAGSATALDPASLETQGQVTFRDDLKHMPFLAHPRIEPDGRIWNIGSGGAAVYVWRLSKDGMFEAGEAVKLPMASYIHDFTATARHLVILCQPWIAGAMKLPFSKSLTWQPELGSKVLVLDKDDLSKRRVYDLPPLSFFHLGDAWEETDGTIRFDGCFHKDVTFAVEGAPGLVEGRYVHVERPELNLVALHPDGRATLTPAGITAEFPRSAPERAGLPRSATVHVGGYTGTRPFARSVGSWDWISGRHDSFDFGARHLVEEFVPAGPHHLIGTTLNLDAKATELHLFDARRIADGPVTSWRSDVALPVSFHGSWVAA
ncbi:carotenoid oxygenase family protein [Blastomonas sp. CCH1-A6]|uniref:carotenoid oxygenase family protein n=1 Tax=Blastomonas sp. CCH1-A6 TaxID=1768762 RepID=UPI0008368205